MLLNHGNQSSFVSSSHDKYLQREQSETFNTLSRYVNHFRFLEFHVSGIAGFVTDAVSFYHIIYMNALITYKDKKLERQKYLVVDRIRTCAGRPQ